MSNQHPFLNAPENLRTSYLVVLSAAKDADRKSSPEEIAFVEQMAIGADLSEENRNIVTNATTDISSVNFLAHLESFKDHELKYSLMADMLNLAYADGSLNDEEATQLNKINEVLGIQEQQFNALKEYVKASNKEAEQKDGSPDIRKAEEAQEEEKSFLEKTGLGNMFQSMGIPVGNFQNGSTVGSAITSTAFSLLQTYVKANTQTGSGNSLGDTLGQFIGNMLDGGKKEGEVKKGGATNMIASFFTSQAGTATINSLLQNVTNSVAQGKGIGNIGSIFGGASAAGNTNNNQNLVGGILGALMQSGFQK